MPAIEKILDKVGKWAEKIDSLDESQIDLIINLGLMVAALSPVISTIGKLTTGIGNAISAYGNFREGLGLLITKAEASGSAMTGLLNVIQGMTSPIGLACIAIGTAIAGIAIASNNANKEVQKSFEIMGNSAYNFITGIKSAESYLSSFNSTLFATSEEQAELSQNMDEIQKAITEICKRASDERRGYTQEEITQLDEYFTKLRELKEREIQIQNEIATAITQQAVTNAETFQGSLEEYQIQSQKWLNSAIQQKDATVALIEQGTIEEVALLNQRYTTEEERQSEAYQTEYAKIMEQKQAKIDEANDEVAKISEVYANGYLERSQQEDSFYNTLKECMEKQEKLQEGHNQKIEQIKNDELWYVTNKSQAITSENETFSFHQKEIWQQMYKDMDDAQKQQLGIWLTYISQTEMYGGQISDETQKMVDSIMDSYDSMPDKTKEAMKNAMSPMLDEMKKSEPTLFAKASNIAEGILKRLKQSFDIHSPSKKTRRIMKFVMQPMEEEMEEGKKNLINEAANLADGVSEKLKNISGNVDVSQTRQASKNSNNNSNQENYNVIDYEKLYKVFLRALNSCKIQIDEDGFVHFIDNRLMEVM